MQDELAALKPQLERTNVLTFPQWLCIVLTLLSVVGAHGYVAWAN